LALPLEKPKSILALGKLSSTYRVSQQVLDFFEEYLKKIREIRMLEFFAKNPSNLPYIHTIRNLHFLHFLSKNSTLISRENCRKTRENVVVLTTLISREKLSKKIWVKNSLKCSFFGQNLTFRIV